MVSLADAFSFDNDAEELAASFPNLTDSYIPVERIGEGTFSVVFKAIDVNHYSCNNSSWIASSLQEPDDFTLYSAEIVEKLQPKTILQKALKSFFKESLKPNQKPVFVALKRINMSSNPDRVKDELLFLKELSGAPNVVPLITAIRHEDQIIAVYPYFKHEDFQEYYHRLSYAEIKHYMRSLLISVQSVHSKGIIHRDLKPNNFLYSLKERRGVLVDFGLAQKEPQNINTIKPTVTRRMAMRNKVTIPLVKDGSSLLYTPNAFHGLKKIPPGYHLNDTRPPMKANRAGTRGFRAPEVLFKYADQSRAIDIWSIGVIFLSLLCRRYPFFNSPDDQDALVEIASVIGTINMEKTAFLAGRMWKCDLPHVPAEHLGFENIASAFDLLEKMLNPNWFDRISATAALQHAFFE